MTHPLLYHSPTPTPEQLARRDKRRHKARSDNQHRNDHAFRLRQWQARRDAKRAKAEALAATQPTPPPPPINHLTGTYEGYLPPPKQKSHHAKPPTMRPTRPRNVVILLADEPHDRWRVDAGEVIRPKRIPKWFSSLHTCPPNVYWIASKDNGRLHQCTHSQAKFIATTSRRAIVLTDAQIYYGQRDTSITSSTGDNVHVLLRRS